MPKPVGRPKSDIETEMLAVRIPVDLGEQLNRYLDRLETRIGIKANRASIARHALKVFLDAQDHEEEKVSTQRESQPLLLPSVQASAQPKQPQSKMRRQILELLQDHPEGLSPVDTRRMLNAEKDLGQTMKSMARDGLLRRLEIGRYSVAG
jgi:Arc/MetJ-type ribon-helix-helix transcriptional regulator